MAHLPDQPQVRGTARPESTAAGGGDIAPGAMTLGRSAEGRGEGRVQALGDNARAPLFLEPQPYRRRRVLDAARLLPVFGLFLLVVPPGMITAGQTTSTKALLIFLVLIWAVLVLGAAGIAGAIRRSDPVPEGAGGSGGWPGPADTQGSGQSAAPPRDAA